MVMTDDKVFELARPVVETLLATESGGMTMRDLFRVMRPTSPQDVGAAVTFLVEEEFPSVLELTVYMPPEGDRLAAIVRIREENVARSFLANLTESHERATTSDGPDKKSKVLKYAHGQSPSMRPIAANRSSPEDDRIGRLIRHELRCGGCLSIRRLAGEARLSKKDVTRWLAEEMLNPAPSVVSFTDSGRVTRAFKQLDKSTQWLGPAAMPKPLDDPLGVLLGLIRAGEFQLSGNDVETVSAARPMDKLGQNWKGDAHAWFRAAGVSPSWFLDWTDLARCVNPTHWAVRVIDAAMKGGA